MKELHLVSNLHNNAHARTQTHTVLYLQYKKETAMNFSSSYISRSTAGTAIFIALNTETTSFSKTLAPTYQMTRYHNPQDNSTYVLIIISLSK